MAAVYYLVEFVPVENLRSSWFRICQTCSYRVHEVNGSLEQFDISEFGFDSIAMFALTRHCNL
jgi:hypothetical protein